MAQFLNTSATNYFLEELIKSTNDKLILISPFLKLNNRIKELLEDKNRLKIDMRIVYGKVELKNEEISWLKEITYIRTSFCENLHAKCYMNEKMCIVTSMNLYDFSQVNNNEMGILIKRDEDPDLYKATKEEVNRIIRISDEVRMSIEKVKKEEETTYQKLTTSKLATKHKMKTDELNHKLVELGYLELKSDKFYLTEKGKGVGGIWRPGKFGGYILWNEDMAI
ncbi:phospholipase D family protein [Sulfurospirillum sp. 1612]|uniref:phospholipase D family protein n=1 Tax=Sulfurospirillum sp. 1612 TaxID=3094835 RepID=UPI002F94B804